MDTRFETREEGRKRRERERGWEEHGEVREDEVEEMGLLRVSACCCLRCSYSPK